MVNQGAIIRPEALCISEGDEVLDVDGLYTGTARKRVLGMIEIRCAALIPAVEAVIPKDLPAPSERCFRDSSGRQCRHRSVCGYARYGKPARA